ncbi:unnamed protein product [Brassica oleracea]
MTFRNAKVSAVRDDATKEAVAEKSLFWKGRKTKVISSLMGRRMKMISPRLRMKLLKPFGITPSEIYP